MFLMQQPAFVPVQLRSEPALPCSFTGLQRLVQQRQSLFNLACDLTRPRQEGDKIGHPQLRPGCAISHQTAAQQRLSLHRIALFDLDPSAIDASPWTPETETLLGRNRNQLVYPLAEDCIVSGERKQQGANRQARSQ